MPVQLEPSFEKKEIPKEDLKNLAIEGTYIQAFSKEKPIAPLIDSENWKNRYCSLAGSFEAVLDNVYNFEVREDDVWIVTSTKCGTTWTQEMTWLILNDLDYKTAKTVDLTIRSPFLEFNGIVPNVPYDTLKAANELPSPRLIKSHLPAQFLPKQLWTKKPKIIYVFRNPKDAAISYFHHWRGLVGYKGTKEEFMGLYMDGHVQFNPFWPHVLDFYNMRNEENVFFTSYEQMKKDLGKVIKGISKFINKPIAENDLAGLIDHLSFDKMKNNPACNHEKEFQSLQAASGLEGEEFRFVRRGVVGSHKDEMPKEVIDQFDEWNRKELEKFNLKVEDFTSFEKVL